MNHGKDIVACILNLCAKGLLEIDKKGSNSYSLVPIESINSNILKPDEEYLYDKICNKKKIDVNIWTKLVKDEFKKYNFIKKNKMNLGTMFLLLYFIIMIVLMIFPMLGENINVNILIIPLFVAVILAMIEPVIKIIIKYLRKGEYFDGIYTIKGAIEMKKWDKYKKFLEHYTLIKDKPLESVVILQNHLAYSMVLNINKNYEKTIIQELEIKSNINMEYIADMLKDL